MGSLFILTIEYYRSCPYSLLSTSKFFQTLTRWCPPVINWFTNRMNTIDISAINHSYWSYNPTLLTSKSAMNPTKPTNFPHGFQTGFRPGAAPFRLHINPDGICSLWRSTLAVSSASRPSSVLAPLAAPLTHNLHSLKRYLGPTGTLRKMDETMRNHGEPSYIGDSNNNPIGNGRMI